MGESVDPETSSVHLMLDANYFPTGGRHEDVDPAELREGSWIYQTSSITSTPFQGHPATPSEQSIVLEDPEANTYGHAPPLPTWVSQLRGGHYGVPASGGIMPGVPPLYLYPSQHATDVPANPQHDPPAATPTYHNPEFAYLAYPQNVPLPPALRANIAAPEYGDNDSFGSTHPVGGVPTAGVFRVENQFPSATLGDGSYNGMASMALYFGGIHYPHPRVTEPRSLPDNAQPTLTVSNITDGSEHREFLPAHGAGNEGRTQLPAGSRSVGFENGRSQGPKKRKRATTQDGKRRPKRTWHRKSQYLDLEEPSQPTLPTIPPSHPDLHVVEQFLYQCKTRQEGWAPLPSIEFRAQGVDGINLSDALDTHFNGPDGRDDPMFADVSIGNSVSCRIAFMDYPTCKPRQIATTNHKKERVRITRKKLAHDIAKCIKSYHKELEEGGNRFHVRFEDMYLVRLRNVARAAWQPELWYRDSSSTSS